MDEVCLWWNLLLADLDLSGYDLSVCLRPLVTLTSTSNLWQRRNEAAIIWLINTDFPTDGIYLQTRPCFWDWLWFYWWDKNYTLMVGDFRDCYEKIGLFFFLAVFLFFFHFFSSDWKLQFYVFSILRISVISAVLVYCLFFFFVFVWFYPVPGCNFCFSHFCVFIVTNWPD